MIIVDPLYGQFLLSDPIRRLCLTPEVRRLSQIRLLNTLTPSLAVLGELRRFSHTLGVLFLASHNDFLANSKEKDAFSASVLLHDIGTPPFGHLFEYHLKERKAWNHESVIRQILRGSHAPENKAHQFFARRTIMFASFLQAANIDLDLVEEIVSGGHRLSQLLFGTLDFDNLDNVARMNWALGQLKSSQSIQVIGKHLSVSEDGKLQLPEECRADIDEWLELRRNAYEVIVFDPPTVAAQAVLSNAIEIALESGGLHEDDWALTDEGLIEILMNNKLTKKAISTQYLGRLPEQAFVIQVKGSMDSFGFSSRRELTSALQEEISKILGAGSLGYVFVDRGTFTKRITLSDPNTASEWVLGTSSESVILYGFTKGSRVASHQKCLRAVQAVIERLSIDAESFLRCKVGSDSDRIVDAQQTLKITT